MSHSSDASASSSGSLHSPPKSRDDISPNYDRCHQAVKKFAVGQVLALLIGFTGLFSQLLARNGIDMPTTQNALNYFFLSFSLILHAAKNKWKFPQLSSPLWTYAVVALLDLEANYMVVKAYQCTDITSIMLLDCMTIPTCFILSKLFLKAQYSFSHYLGIVLCLIGIVIILISDTAFTTNTNTSMEFEFTTPILSNMTTVNPIAAFCLDTKVVGDVLCLSGSVLYAVSNVAQESIVKDHSITEFLGFLGLFGFIFSIVQIAALEHQELASQDWQTTENIGYLLGFAASLLSMYILTSVFLRMADSTFFNISLLFSDIWAIIAGYVIFHTIPQWLYFVAAPFVVAGCIVYSSRKVTFMKAATSYKSIAGTDEPQQNIVGSSATRCCDKGEITADISTTVVTSGRLTTHADVANDIQRKPLREL